MRNYLKMEQTRLGLLADGVLGPKTAEAMMNALSIKNKLFFAHMMGQCQVESGYFQRFRENMNYTAQGLANTWSRYSKTGQRGGPPNPLAFKLAGDAKAIANHVYANRLGNGDELSGDGYFYRGGLGIQTTGRTNWLRFFDYAGLPTASNPDTLIDNSFLFFLGAKFWFIDNQADKLCVAGHEDCILNVSRKVNLGTTATQAMPNASRERQLATQDILQSIGLV